MNKLLNILLFFLILTVFSCSTFDAPKTHKVYIVKSEFFNTIMNDYKKGFAYEIPLSEDKYAKLQEIEINLKTLNDPTMGVCYYEIVGARKAQISISYSLWKSRDNFKLMSVVYHEIGHCICNLEHTLSEEKLKDKFLMMFQNRDKYYYKDNCAKSLMYPFTLPENCLLDHWQEYLKDLRKRCK